MSEPSTEAPTGPPSLAVARPVELPVELESLRRSVRAGLFGSDEDPVRIGRFRLLRCIGRGGMGVVWAAHDDELGRTVAIKLLRPDLGGQATSGLDKEARALAKLSHPNVVSVFDVGTHEGSRFIAMEFVEGQTLREWSLTPRALKTTLNVFIDAGRGLAAAHAVGLVHRDFKPDNVLVSPDSRAKVLDFGLARPPSHAATRPPSIAHDADPMATAATHGLLLGTPAFMSPEQHLGAPADARSDQFSFAVALWTAVYGQSPFEGDDLRTLSLAVVRGVKAPPPAERDVPSWLRVILDRALAVDPAARFDAMEQLLRALERAAEPAVAEDEGSFDTRQVEAVLGRAVELQAASHAPRLSARDLEAVGVEAGIDPTLMRQAAHENAAGLAVPSVGVLSPPVEEHMGFRRSVHATRTLPEYPTPEALALVVRELERSEGRGRALPLGPCLTWQNRSLEVHVDPTPNGTTLMLWRKLDALAIRRAWSFGAAGAFAGFVASMIVLEAVGLLSAGGTGEMICLVLVIGAMIGSGRGGQRLARRVHGRDLDRRQNRLEFTADRLSALVVAAHSHPPGDPA